MTGKHKKRLSSIWLVTSALLGVMLLGMGVLTIVLHLNSPVVTGDSKAEQPAEIAKIKAALANETGIVYYDNSEKSEPVLIVDEQCTVALLWAWDGKHGEYQYNSFPGGIAATPYKPVLTSEGKIDASGIRASCQQAALVASASVSSRASSGRR